VVSTTAPEVYPLAFEPRLVAKVWGGRKLEETFGRQLPGEGPIGEVWTVWDGLQVANGILRGRRLVEVLHRAGPAYLGQPVDAHLGGAFPLLVKFLDARENLSVQVHPDDAYARARETPSRAPASSTASRAN
jgi:mannose-6-phosphate isomerase